MSSHFQTKDLGSLEYFLGIKVAQSKEDIVVMWSHKKSMLLIKVNDTPKVSQDCIIFCVCTPKGSSRKNAQRIIGCWKLKSNVGYCAPSPWFRSWNTLVSSFDVGCVTRRVICKQLINGTISFYFCRNITLVVV